MDAPLRIHDRDAIRKFLKRYRVDPYALKRLCYALLVQGLSDAKTLLAVPARDRAVVAEHVRLHSLTPVKQYESQQDGATKFVFRTARGQLIETVAMKARTGRTTVCVSSQVGCAAGCKFCATAQMGLQGQLSADEILDQVVFVRQFLTSRQLRLRNVVFMGMGEPLHNEGAVFQALHELHADDRFRFPANRVLLSSIGVPGAAERFAARFAQTGFALSLHALDPSLREELIPLARHVSLDQLRGMLERLLVGGRSVMVEYLMLRGINDAVQDAAKLAEFLRGLRVHINLIPYNRFADSEFETSAMEQRDKFARVLREAGFLTTIRYSQGQDIAAACGQLAIRVSPSLPANKHPSGTWSTEAKD